METACRGSVNADSRAVENRLECRGIQLDGLDVQRVDVSSSRGRRQSRALKHRGQGQVGGDADRGVPVVDTRDSLIRYRYGPAVQAAS